MKNILSKLLFLVYFLPPPANAGLLSIDDALRATYTACINIDNEISHLKTMAGINTAVTAVGTAAGAGAITVGFIKANKDELIEKLEMEKLKKIEESGINSGSKNPPSDQVLAAADNYFTINQSNTSEIDSEIEQLNKQSKKLGNWRTGLLAANTATNIAGAAIAGTNKVDQDLNNQIQNCISSVKNLRNAIMQARINGENVSEAETIANACGEYEYVDISKINKRGTGAMISSTIGAATGLAGTVTSGIANNDNTRNNNTINGKQREKTLNTAANALSIGATAASVTATVFNATQIAAIKKVAAVSEKCTGVLK